MWNDDDDDDDGGGASVRYNAYKYIHVSKLYTQHRRRVGRKQIIAGNFGLFDGFDFGA